MPPRRPSGYPTVYKLALRKITLDGAFERANIYKLYLLHSRARTSLITYK